MVPSVAATCAAVSAVSILYDHQGVYQEMYHLRAAPEVVILDSQIIAAAPVRWLSAGIGDTLVNGMNTVQLLLRGRITVRKWQRQ